MTDAAPAIPLRCPHAPPRTDEAGPWLICVACADAYATERERAVWAAAAQLAEASSLSTLSRIDSSARGRALAAALRARAEPERPA